MGLLMATTIPRLPREVNGPGGREAAVALGGRAAPEARSATMTGVDSPP